MRSDLRVKEVMVVVFLLISGEALELSKLIKNVVRVLSDLEERAMKDFT